MTKAAVASYVHQSLDIHLGLASQRAFDLVFRRDYLADLRDLFIAQLTDMLGRIDTGLLKYIERRSTADSKNISQADFGSLIFR
jgi:hypothetical protein